MGLLKGLAHGGVALGFGPSIDGVLFGVFPVTLRPGQLAFVGPRKPCGQVVPSRREKSEREQPGHDQGQPSDDVALAHNAFRKTNQAITRGVMNPAM